MSLSERERQIMIDLHLEKAGLFLQQADEMCELKHWDLAINRYYYASFHALHALYVAYGMVAHTHDGLITVFGKEFVQTGKVDKRYGRYLARMEQLRKLADYNCITSVTEDEVHELSVPAHELLGIVQSLLQK
jgi:uncharacterized protein (UPF0332 family)